MVGQIARGVPRARRGRIVQHPGIPLLPGGLHRIEALGLAPLEIAAFERVGDDVEQELVVVDPEVLVLAEPMRALALVAVAPEQRALRHPHSGHRPADFVSLQI